MRIKRGQWVEKYKNPSSRECKFLRKNSETHCHCVEIKKELKRHSSITVLSLIPLSTFYSFSSSSFLRSLLLHPGPRLWPAVCWGSIRETRPSNLCPDHLRKLVCWLSHFICNETPRMRPKLTLYCDLHFNNLFRQRYSRMSSFVPSLMYHSSMLSSASSSNWKKVYFL